MHLKTSQVRRNGKTYTYAKIVESYRRKSDGMPTQRVVHKLGKLSAEEIQKWRTALEAMRSGKPLIIPDCQSSYKTVPPKPDANLRYLDLAVLLELWNKWGMTELLDEMMPAGDTHVPPSAVVTALALQRCVDPAPKSYAVEWFPRTALPELLGISPSQFNNTRIHRALDSLYEIDLWLQRRLPRLYKKQSGSFATLFMDITDTWFVGHGPSSAQKAKTKEGRFERKVNIILLCNEHGYPIRWQVIPGRSHDSKAMIKMFGAIKGLDWLGHTPVVCDRAMGCTAHIRKLLKTNVHFLTAMTKNEFGSYTKEIPSGPLLDYQPVSGDKFTEKDIGPVSKLVENAGVMRVSTNLYIKDLGVVTYDTANQHNDDGECADKLNESTAEHKTVEAMRYCLKLRSDKEEGRANNNRIAGIPYGLNKSKVARFLQLTKLPEDVQKAILEGQAIGLSVNDLVRIAALKKAEQQRAEFERLKAKVAQKYDGRRNRGASKATKIAPPQEQPKPFDVRTVLYFNPEIFIQKRITANKTLAHINSFVEELNEEIASLSSRKTVAGIERAIKDKLRACNMSDAFDVLITKSEIGGMERYQAKVTLKAGEWKNRRQYDGFSLIVGHPEIEGSGEDLCQLYRSKDTIETDFRVIKSFIKLRPIGHRNEHKVRAHVTICMLALLIERTLKKRLEAMRFRFSSTKTLDVLNTCNLNMYEGIHNNPVAYSVTKPNEDQQAVLRTLRLKHLSDDMEVIDRITPR